MCTLYSLVRMIYPRKEYAYQFSLASHPEHFVVRRCELLKIEIVTGPEPRESHMEECLIKDLYASSKISPNATVHPTEAALLAELSDSSNISVGQENDSTGLFVRVSKKEEQLIKQLYAIKDNQASRVISPDAPVHPTEVALLNELSDSNDISVGREDDLDVEAASDDSTSSFQGHIHLPRPGLHCESDQTRRDPSS